MTGCPHQDRLSPQTPSSMTGCLNQVPPPQNLSMEFQRGSVSGSWGDRAPIRSHLQLCGFQSLSNWFFKVPMQVYWALLCGGWSVLLLCMWKGLRTRLSVYILSAYVDEVYSADSIYLIPVSWENCCVSRKACWTFRQVASLLTSLISCWNLWLGGEACRIALV